MRRRRHRIDAADAHALQDGNLPSGSLQQVGGGQAGKAGADDNGVDVEVTVERRIAGNRLGVGPV